MFRCVTKLKLFVIDIDSFEHFDNDVWTKISEIVPCLFLTWNNGLYQLINGSFRHNCINLNMQQNIIVREFSPNESLHCDVLRRENLKNSEIVYISADEAFIKRAEGFYCGTIFITESLNYKCNSIGADIVLCSLWDLLHVLVNDLELNYGERKVVQQDYNGKFQSYIIPFDIDEEEFEPLIFMGRYFGTRHYMSSIHPYSNFILINKDKRSNAYGKGDHVLFQIYEQGVAKYLEHFEIDGICSVPARKGEQNRFQNIVSDLCEKYKLENYTDNFVCIKDYPTQKQYDAQQRRENIKGVFRYNGDLTGKYVILIDDVITTGSTIVECVKELKRRGATRVCILVLAINQLGVHYARTDQPELRCPVCGSPMSLKMNSKTANLFFSCLNCYYRHQISTSYSLEEGLEILATQEDNKFNR